MASQTRYAGTITQSGNVLFSDLKNLKNSNNSYATSGLLGGTNNPQPARIVCSNFGFNIPTSAKITSIKIEYSPMYDEVRIYYECMYVTYDRGDAMNAVLECLEDFRVEHKYNLYRYLKDDKEKFFKDDKGRRKAQYNSYVKFYR